MSIRKRLMLFFTASFLLLIIAIITGYLLYSYRKEIKKTNEILERGKNADIALKLASESIQKIIEDYSFWDELHNFAAKKSGPEWGDANLKPLLINLNLNCIFTCSKNGKIIYSAVNGSDLGFEQKFEVQALYYLVDTCANSAKRFAQFYQNIDNQLIQYSVTTIHPTLDNQKLTSAGGFFVVGKIIDTTYLKRLGTITSSTVSIGLQQDTIINSESNTYYISKKLSTWDNRFAAKYIFKSVDIYAEKEEHYNSLSFLVYIFWIVLVLIGGSVLIRRRVSIPLKNIVKCLDNNEVELLKKELNRTDEFGQIAVLIKDFFEQKQILHNEIEERRAIQEELEKVNKMLFDQNYEIATNNNILQQQKEEMSAQAELLEKINSELEKLTLAMSKSDNSVIITDAKGNIVWHNDGLARLMEISPDDFFEHFGSNIFTNGYIAGHPEYLAEAIRARKSIIYSYKSIKKSGKEIWLQTTLTPAFDEDGQLDKIIAIDSDITHVKFAEQKIARQSENITNSLNYAKRIQKAIFPPTEALAKFTKENFILLKPKDIVSGDFFWFKEKEGLLYIAAADCTGHGVPGAFMSLLGISFLEQLIASAEEPLPANEILNKLREHTIQALHLSGNVSESKDGMNISLCIVDFMYRQIQFSGAMNSIWQFRQSKDGAEIFEHEADKMPIGIGREYKPFTNNKFSYENGDILYLFSDGFYDQFGGEMGRKFLKVNFKNLLAEICGKPLAEQKELLQATFLKWKGTRAQIDDILVMGLKF
jgi:PAS domain S-box-containing protein